MRVSEEAIVGWSTTFRSEEVLQSFKTSSRVELPSERRDAEAVKPGL